MKISVFLFLFSFFSFLFYLFSFYWNIAQSLNSWSNTTLPIAIKQPTMPEYKQNIKVGKFYSKNILFYKNLTKIRDQKPSRSV